MTGRTYAERVITWNVPEVPGVTFGKVEDTNREWKLVLDRYYVGAITEVPGRARSHLTGVEGRMEAGSIYLLEPGEAFRVEEGAAGGYSSSFFIPPETLLPAAAEIDPEWRRVYFPLPDVRDEELHRLIVDCGEAFAQPASALERQSLFTEMLHCLLTRFSGREPSGNTTRYGGALEQAADLIRRRLTESVSLEELARAVGLPLFKFLRAFKRRFALTPHDFQVKARLALAQEILKSGAPLATAAAEAGFSDQSHFTRHFKRVYTVTPAEFWGR